MVSSGSPFRAVAARELRAEHRADRPVDVSDWKRERDRGPVLERLVTSRDQLVVQRLVEAVVLRRDTPAADVGPDVGLAQDPRTGPGRAPSSGRGPA